MPEFWENTGVWILLGFPTVQKKIVKISGLAIALLAIHGCARTLDLLRGTGKQEPGTAKNQISNLSCLDSLPNLAIEKIRKNEPSKNAEDEADRLEKDRKNQQALEKYSESHTLYFGELGRASGRALWGDFDAAADINISVGSPTFLFKVGRAFAGNKQYLAAIACFNESLEGGISAPNDAIAHLNRGDAYERMGDKIKAKVDFQQAVNLFKKYKLASYQKTSEQRLKSIK